MQNRYQPYRRRGIRFFPHIIPIAFPLIFPLGFGLLAFLFHIVYAIIGVLLLIALAFFIIKVITTGSPQSAWNSMRNSGTQWQQKFNSQQPQTPYYQPPQQQQTPYYQPPTQQTPYYQPPTQAGQEQQPEQYGQGYQPQQPTYRPVPNEYEQPETQYP
ncbi:MAG TPA: hypothetical protein VNE38_02840, partial [Ktedonobacteraceae bacterium]|nr:hypothetical protein [Ktedonobacteraceae bacterium]